MRRRFDFDPSRKVWGYSKGNRQKINLIAALASRAGLLILDEPTAGLDPLMEQAFWESVLEARATADGVPVAVGQPRGPGTGGLRRVAFNTRWLLQAVERFTRRRLEPIRFIGGGARSDVWCQIFADVLGRTIEQVAEPVNAGTRGAGLLAAVALGEFTFDQTPDRIRVVASYQPDPALMKHYDNRFREFVALYRRNRKAYARRNRERATGPTFSAATCGREDAAGSAWRLSWPSRTRPPA